MHPPDDFSLGQPKKFETLELKTRSLAPPPGSPAAAGVDVAPELTEAVLAEIAILVRQGKAGPRIAKHAIECVLYRHARSSGDEAAEAGPRGVCIVVPGMLGTHSADALVNALIEDRWMVAVVWPPLADRAKESMRETAGKPVAERGAMLAGCVDSLIEDAALVAQSALIRLHAGDGDLRGKPVILVGESMGAIAGVGMAATGQLPFDAALFVAGGGDLIDVTRGSALRSFLDEGGLVDDAEFVQSYRAACRFDPLRAGSSLSGGPVAVITAARDAIVPSETQESLWRALGEPPRYVWEGGHFELFWRGSTTVVPVARRIADAVGGRSRAVDVLYRRTVEQLSPEESEAIRSTLPGSAGGSGR